jgi:hypothetical protein
LYVPSNGVIKNIKQKLTETQEAIDKSIILVGKFSSLNPLASTITN